MYIPHSKKLAAAGALGASLPFMLGADVAASPDDVSFWIFVAKLAVASLVPPVTVGVGLVVRAAGAALIAWGKAKLADRDPGNDAIGAAAVAAGERLAAPSTHALPPAA